MNSLLQRLMKEATRLTHSGNLHAATEAIQRALHGRLPGTQDKNTAHSPFPPMAIPRNTPRAAGAAMPDDTVVEGYMRFVDDPVDTGTDVGARKDATTAGPIPTPAMPVMSETSATPATSSTAPLPVQKPVTATATPSNSADHAQPDECVLPSKAPTLAPIDTPAYAPVSAPLTPHAADPEPIRELPATPLFTKEVFKKPADALSEKPVAAPPLLPAQPEQWSAGSFSNPSRTMAYKLYMPPREAANTRVALPLILMLHGCTQNPDDFASGTQMNALARKHGFAVIYPEQTQHANSHKCWNWFKTQHQQRGRGEPALLAELTQAVMAEQAIDPSRVYVAGLSAGGAMADIMARCYPDVFAAVGVHSGLPTGAAADVMSALSVMRNGTPAIRFGGKSSPMPPTIVFHGDADATVHPRNGAAVVRAARGSASAELAPRVTTGRSAKGQSFTRTEFPPAPGYSAVEEWVLHGAGHAWSGGSSAGSYTDPAGADASGEMLRFFLAHPMEQASAMSA